MRKISQSIGMMERSLDSDATRYPHCNKAKDCKTPCACHDGFFKKVRVDKFPNTFFKPIWINGCEDYKPEIKTEE